MAELKEGYVLVHQGGVTMEVLESDAFRFLSHGYEKGEAVGLTTEAEDDETIVKRDARVRLQGYPEAEIVKAENKAWSEHQKTAKLSKVTEGRSSHSVPNIPPVSNKSSENK